MLQLSGSETERDRVPYLVKLIKGWARTFLWIRIRMDLHHFDNLVSNKNKDPDPNQFADEKPKCMEMSLFEHFFKGLSLYLEARIWILIRIRSKLGSGSSSASNKNPYLHQIKIRIRIRIRIRVISRIRIRIKVMLIHNTGPGGV
jgi:hypothetical protein